MAVSNITKFMTNRNASVNSSASDFLSKKLSISNTGANSITPQTIESNINSPQKTAININTLLEISSYIYNETKYEPSRAKKNIHEQLIIINQTLISDSENYSYQQAKILSNAFIKISKKMTLNKEAAELSYLTGKMLKTSWFEKLKQLNFPNVFEKFTPFGEPGASKSRTVKCSLSAGVGVIPTSSLNAVNLSATANVGYSNTLEYGPDDEGLFFKSKYHKTTAGLTGKFGSFAKGSLSASGTYFTSDEFNNVKAYAENEGTKLKDPDASNWEKFKSRFKLDSDMHRLYKQEQFTANAKERFNELLEIANIAQNEFTAPFPRQNVPLPCYGIISSGSLAGNVAVTTELAGNVLNFNGSLGAGASVSHTTTELHQFIPGALCDIVTQTAEKIHEIPSKLLKRIKRENLNNQAEIIRVLQDLEEDIEKYYHTARNYDYLVNTAHSNTKEKRRLQKIKHKIENKWGAIGRHQLLQILWTSHAFIAIKANLNDEDIAKKFNKVKSLLSEPQMAYSRKLMLEIASFQQDAILDISETNLSIDLQAPIFSGNVSFARRYRGHPNWLREGDYIDISITGKANLNTSSVFDASAISNLIISAALKENIEIPNDLSIVPDVGVDGAIDCTLRFFKPKFSQEEGFPAKTGWRKLFTRIRGSVNIGGSVSAGATVAPSIIVNGSLGANTSKTVVLKEYIASDDLIYPMTRFNRFYRNNKFDPLNKDWLNFTQAHKPELHDLFHNLADEQSPARIELLYRLAQAYELALDDELKQQIETTQNNLLEQLKIYHATSSEADYQQVLETLSHAFGYLVAPWWKRHVSTWGAPMFLASKNSGLNFGSKLKLRLGLTKRGKVKFEKVAESKIISASKL